MRVISTIVIFGLSTVTVSSQQTGSEAYQAAAVRLVMAYQCVSLTGDEEAYERAKDAARETVGEGEPLSAEGLIAAVEAQPTGQMKLSAPFCEDTIAGYDDAR